MSGPAVGNDGLLVASDESTLHTAVDTREGDDPSLASDSTFQQAMASLPADSLLKAFADPGKIGRLLSLGNSARAWARRNGNGAATSSLQQLSKALSGIRSASFALWATDGGYRASAQIATVPGSSGSIANAFATTSTLQRYVPAGSPVHVNGGGSTGGYQQMFNAARHGGTAQRDSEADRHLGRPRHPAAADRRAGAYAAPGQPGEPPTIELLLKPKNETAGSRALLTCSCTSCASARAGTSAHLPARPRPQVIAGAVLDRLEAWNGIFTVGNDAPRFSGNRRSAGRLTCLERAARPPPAHRPLRMSRCTSSCAQALELFPIEENENLTHVGGILAWSTVAGNQVSANLFVRSSNAAGS